MGDLVELSYKGHAKHGPSRMIQPNQSKPIADQASSHKLRLVLGMQRSGIRMMRQNLVGRHPDDSPEQIDRRLSEWLARTPDADDPRFEIRQCKTQSKNS